MPAFQSVQYIDPFAPLPTGASQAGVSASVTGAPAGTVAYAQLLGNQIPIGYGTGSTGTAVRVLNTMPLVAGLSYQLLVQFQAAGKNPADLDWSNPSLVLGSPVVVELGRINTAQVSSTGIAVSWEPPATSSIAGGFVQLVDLTSNAITGSYYLGPAQNATLTASFTTGHSYGLRLSAVQPITGGTMGSFAAPYTVGPPGPVLPIPVVAPALASLSCTEAGVAATWTAPAVPSGAGPTRYEILLLDGGKLIASGPAGDTGGQLATSELAGLADPQLAARVSYGSFVGPAGGSAGLFPLAPQIVSVSAVA